MTNAPTSTTPTADQMSTQDLLAFVVAAQIEADFMRMVHEMRQPTEQRGSP